MIDKKQCVKSRSARVREMLNHPIVDSDGHIVEVLPVLYDYIRQIGGADVLARFLATLPGARGFDGGVDRVGGPLGWHGLTPQQRQDKRVARPSFWAYPAANTLDRATVMLPRLFRERLDDLGIDFAILYTSAGLWLIGNPDAEIRQVVCRAFNAMVADLYREHASRMTVAALIPSFTPQEAIAELEYAVGDRGLKAAMIGTCVRRPIADVERTAPQVAAYATWLDPLGVSSQYDYDPLWQRCMQLKVAVTAHSGTIAWGARNSPENFVYNHIGHFAAAGEAFCKALVIGGVVRRFPNLNFAFLEGGVAWACSLYNDLIEHWEKRNIGAMRKFLDPAKLDRSLLGSLFEKYGDSLARRHIDDFANNTATENPEGIDEFAALGTTDPGEFADFFKRFYFGCEGEDRDDRPRFQRQDQSQRCERCSPCLVRT